MEKSQSIIREATPEQVREMIEGSKSLMALIKDKMGAAEFVEAAMQLIKSPQLQECSAESILGGLLKAAIFGFRISPELGQCWLVPRNIKTGETTDQNGKKRNVYSKVATFQIGYKGWQELAFRTGEVEFFDLNVVYDADEFDYEQGSAAFIRHKPVRAINRGSITHVWASATMRSGRMVFDVVTAEEVERHRMFSETQYTWTGGQRQFSAAPTDIWAKHYDAMARRIPIRNLCVLKLPKSDILLRAIEADGGMTTISAGSVTEIAGEEMKNIEIEETTRGQVEDAAETELHDDYKAEIEACKTPESLKELFGLRKNELDGKQKEQYYSLVMAQYKALQTPGK